MVLDSYAQYFEALNFHFYDWHPPIMSVLWTFTNKIIPGAGGIFLLHLSAAVVSLYLIARAEALKDRKLYSLTFVLIFIPSISCFVFTILKDVSLTVSFLLAFSLWYYWTASRKLNRVKLLVIMILVIYASGVRHNALPAAVPLIVLFLSSYLQSKKLILGSILGALVVYGSIYLINYHVLRAEKVYLFQQIMAHDLMGIYAATQKNYFPESFLSQKELDAMMPRFHPATSLFNLKAIPDAKIIRDLKSQWLIAIRENPLAYLNHRWQFYRRFLNDLVWTISPVSTEPFNEVKDVTRLKSETALGSIHTRYVNWITNNCSFLFRTVSYLVGSLVVLIYSVFRKDKTLIALSCSSSVYLLLYFFVAGLVNYRYIYWSVVAFFLSIALLCISSEDYIRNRMLRRSRFLRSSHST